MNLNDIIKVDIQRQTLQVSSTGYFNSCCFFFNSTTLNGFYKIETLDDVLQLGLGEKTPAYIFSKYFLLQKGSNRNLYLQGRRPLETWSSSYDKSQRDKYYFLSIESKILDEILDFNDHIQDENKLQFFSNETGDVSDRVRGRKIVWWRGSRKGRFFLTSEPYPIIEKDFVEISYAVEGSKIIDPYNRVGNYDPEDGTLSNGILDLDYLVSSYSVDKVVIRDTLNIISNYNIGGDLLPVGGFNEDYLNISYAITSALIRDALITFEMDIDPIKISYSVDGALIRDALVETVMDTDPLQISYGIDGVKIQNYEAPPTSAPYDITWVVLPPTMFILASATKDEVIGTTLSFSNVSLDVDTTLNAKMNFDGNSIIGKAEPNATITIEVDE